jgi:hypothetical protein
MLVAEKKAKDRDAWTLILREARVLHGPQNKWRGRQILSGLTDNVKGLK